jgi:hypothetical protein
MNNVKRSYDVIMTDAVIVTNIVFGFSLSMILYFFGQLSRILIEIVDTIIKR